MERSAIVVEDDANTALALTKAIRSLGFSVRVARTLEQARELFRDDCPDLVLLDVTLPDGDGLELIRETPSELQPRFIIVTGDSRQEVAVRSLRARATDFLAKPITMADLRSVVAQASIPDAANEELAADSEKSPLSDTDALILSIDSIVGKTFWEVEKYLLQATLKAHEGNKKLAAQTLGISLKTLYNRLHAYSIDY